MPSYGRGSIVRVRLENFVTYDHVEFYPGPNLNMVIGPNGTGKSSIVCALAIGLGFKPSVLGRAKDVADFIKLQRTEATIEIELQDEPRSHVLRRTLTRDKSLWWLDGRTAGSNQVRDLVASLGIQIDNLCQFLPQDKVGEFAALTPDRLLKEVEKAAGQDMGMLDAHMQLVELRRQLKEVELDLDRDQREVEGLQKQQEQAQRDLESFRLRQEILQRIRTLELKIPFVEYRVAQEEYKAIKAERARVDRKLKELKNSLRPFLLREQSFRQQAEQERIESLKVIESAYKTKTALQALVTDASKMSIERSGLEKDMDLIKERNKQRVSKITDLRREIRDRENSLGEMPVFNDAEDSSQGDIHGRISEIELQIDSINEDLGNFRDRLEANKSEHAALQQRLLRIRSIEGMREELLRKNNKSDTIEAFRWLQKNRNAFQDKVFGPTLFSINIKDARYTPYVESIMMPNDYTTFTCLNREDYLTFTRLLIDTPEAVGRRLRLNVVEYSGTPNPTLDSQRRPASLESIKAMGFDGYLIDFISGPAPVLNSLCHSVNIHQIPVALTEVNKSVLQSLESALQNGQPGIRRFITGDTSVVLTRSKYGNNSVVSSHTRLNLRTNWFKETIDAAEVSHLRHSLEESEQKRVSLLNSIKEAEQRRRAQQQSLESEQRRIALVAAAKKRHKELELQWQRDKDTLERRKRELRALFKSPEAEKKQLVELQEKLKNSILAEADLAVALKDKYISLCESASRGNSALLRRIQADSDLRAFEAQSAADRNRIKELEDSGNAIRTTLAQKKAFAQEKFAIARDSLQELDDATRATFEQEIRDDTLTVEDLREKIDVERSHLAVSLAGPDVMKEYEERAAKLEDYIARVGRKTESRVRLEREIADKRGLWEPRVDAIVQKLSREFSETFASIGCAGEIQVGKPDDFDAWRLEIMVKFRENETLQLLDGYRQSGGERSVSTMFFLMALQSVAQAPFRVVDEINQGMDPRNERLVHARLVEMACTKSDSQYFLITPKLLPNLHYHPKMKVLCVCNGDWLLDEPDGLRLDTYISKKRRRLLTGAGAGS